MKDLKHLISKLADKLTDMDKVKAQVFEKRLSDKRNSNIDRVLDRFVFLCNDYTTKMESLLDRAKAMGFVKEDLSVTPRARIQTADFEND